MAVALFVELVDDIVVRCVPGDAAAAAADIDGGGRANRARDEDGGCIPGIVLE